MLLEKYKIHHQISLINKKLTSKGRSSAVYTSLFGNKPFPKSILPKMRVFSSVLTLLRQFKEKTITHKSVTNQYRHYVDFT